MTRSAALPLCLGAATAALAAAGGGAPAAAAAAWQQQHPAARFPPSSYAIDFSDEKYTPRDVNYTTVVDPSVTWGVWEGWGTSLCWWANVLGDNDTLADVFFSGKDTVIAGRTLPGLMLNIARYNLGASGWREVDGAKMEESPSIPAFKQIEGFWQDWYSDDPDSSSWDWTVDGNRHAMLQKAKDRGANLFEIFSNSPMWWMLKNHNPSGSLTGVTNNLEDWNFRTFTKYLAITVERFKTHRNIAFTSVEPFNEPDSPWWKSTNNQEGCHFDTQLQGFIVELLHQELRDRGLGDIPIAASDENNYDGALHTWKTFDSRQALVGKVNVHGYQYHGGRRDLLYSAVRGKRLWNSEYGDGAQGGLKMATNLVLDFRWLHPTAWVYWQVIDEGWGWGLLAASLSGDHPDVTEVNGKFFVMAQFSRHIRPGMTIIDGGSDHTVAAYDAKARRLVVVTVNYGKEQWVTYDLSKFQVAQGPVRRWCTNTNGGDQYVRYDDTKVTGTTIVVHLPVNTVQTLEVDGVDVDGFVLLTI